jgi:hypothetical protein
MPLTTIVMFVGFPCGAPGFAVYLPAASAACAISSVNALVSAPESRAEGTICDTISCAVVDQGIAGSAFLAKALEDTCIKLTVSSGFLQLSDWHASFSPSAKVKVAKNNVKYAQRMAVIAMARNL